MPKYIENLTQWQNYVHYILNGYILAGVIDYIALITSTYNTNPFSIYLQQGFIFTILIFIIDTFVHFIMETFFGWGD